MDKEFLRTVLVTLKECYPGKTYAVYEMADENKMLSHLRYLDEYELIDSGVHIIDDVHSEGVNYSLGGAKITARGLDYLAEDGGLAAELGTVTIRLHSTTIQDLIEIALAQRDLPAEKRTAIQNALATASTETVKALTTRLIDAAIKHTPDVWGLFAPIV